MSAIDLHSHSTRSDGLLAPAELVRHAAERGVRVLALTDHDDVGGLPEARAAGLDVGIDVVAGVEVSVTWRAQTLHVVGLDVDIDAAALVGGLESIRAGRAVRAARMAADLERVGIGGTLAGAYAYATNPQMISRTHFARHLVEAGVARDVRSVFRRFLVVGKPGYVPHQWATLPQAIDWIHCAGGAAVLAHPGRYGLSPSAMRALLAEFRDLGGDAIEVVSGSHTTDDCLRFARYAREFGLRASSGSDFHGPGEGARGVGGMPELPDGVVPVWHDWAHARLHA